MTSRPDVSSPPPAPDGGLSFGDVASLGCGDCGGDIDGDGQCIDCDAWVSGLEPDSDADR